MPCRILVVDDNVDAATTLSMLLELEGHETTVAHSGPEALTAAERIHPDVVLLDIGLPGMNGYEVARRMRDLAPRPTLVAVTGWGAEEDRRQAQEAGFDHHLVKPVDPAALTELLARIKPS
jgi:CheY-like chemotaxis protein